jgi:hypothetical protein
VEGKWSDLGRTEVVRGVEIEAVRVGGLVVAVVDVLVVEVEVAEPCDGGLRADVVAVPVRAVPDDFVRVWPEAAEEAPRGLEDGGSPEEVVGLRPAGVAADSGIEDGAVLAEALDICLMDAALVSRLAGGADILETVDVL